MRVLYRSLAVLAGSALGRSATQHQRPVTLITFDVDGTLVQGSSAAAQVSAHARSFAHAVGKVFGGVSDWEKTVPSPPMLIPPVWYHGSTDGLIALQLAQHGFGQEGASALERLPSVFDEMYRYVAALSDADVARGIEVLPGVREQLSLLAARRRQPDSDVLVGLVTGNVEGIARKKMRAVGLWQLGFLSPVAGGGGGGGEERWRGEEQTAFQGGFGSCFCSGQIDDLSRLHKDRGEQILLAVARAQASLGPDQRLARVVHVGDAPSDVLAACYCADHFAAAAAAASQAQAQDGAGGIEVGMVGVATGKFGEDELRALMRGRGEGWVVLRRGVGDEHFIKHCGL